MAGRKTKLNEEMISNIEISLQNHNSIKTTCQLCGVSQAWFFEHFNRGEKAKSGLNAEFFKRVNKAQATSKAILVSQISKDAGWQAKAWILERCHHKEFGKRETINHSGELEGENPMPVSNAPAVTIVLGGEGAVWDHKHHGEIEEATDDDLPEEV